MNRTSHDVQGFIEKKECKLTGYWKVYSDVNSAKDKFEKYSKCFRIYLEQLVKDWVHSLNKLIADVKKGGKTRVKWDAGLSFFLDGAEGLLPGSCLKAFKRICS